MDVLQIAAPWIKSFGAPEIEQPLTTILLEVMLTKAVLSEHDPVKAGETRRHCLARHIERIRSKFLSWS
jgi:hypothetical protein